MTNPIDLLPIDFPMEYDPSEGNLDYFYENVTKHLIPDIIRITTNGIHMDMNKVQDLEQVVSNVLQVVSSKLESNKIIQEFHAGMYPAKFKAFKEELETRKRNISYYLKDYKDTVIHRTYVVNAYLKRIGSEHCCKDSWKVADLKGLNILMEDSFIDRVINKELTSEDTKTGMQLLAQTKLDIYNKSIDGKIKEGGTQKKLIPLFNPASSKQLRELFEWMEIEPISLTDKGEPSWDRQSIETVMKYSKDEELNKLLQLFVDHSFSAIIKNNFIEAFKRYTIDGVLYGNIKLFGAKTFRLTSSAPNLLNMPSTTSIYAKPLKECFVAPEGYVILTADFSALEDRVIANLSGDENKTAIFEEGIDGHSLATTYYDAEDVTKLIGEYTNNKDAARKLKALVDDKNKAAKKLRQESKTKTFKLSYGGHPDADMGGDITQEIFDNYHFNMFPAINEFRERIEEDAEGKGYTHLGLGCRLYSSNVFRDTRTLFNGNSQFWSILSLLSVNKMHSLIDDAGLEFDVKTIGTIYDSIYYIVKKDVKTIKWVNDNLIPVMCTDYLKDQRVKNEANSEIGLDWCHLTELTNNATEKEIEEVLKELK